MCAKYLMNDMAQLAMKYESGTYGTASGAGVWLGMVTNHTLNEDMGVVPVRYVGGVTRNVEAFNKGPTVFTGTIDYYPQDFRMLKFAFGMCADAGSPSPFTHTYTEADSDETAPEFASQVLPSFTLEDAHTYSTGSNAVRTINGCAVNTYSVTLTPGQPVACNIGYTAQNVVFSSGAKTSITDPATSPFYWENFTVTLPSGTNINEINSAALTITNNLAAKNYVSSGANIHAFIPQNRDYELTLDVNETSDWMKTFEETYWAGGSEFNIMMNGILSAGSRTIRFTGSGCRITAFNSPTTGENECRATMTIKPKTMDAVEDSLSQYYNAGSYA